MPASAINKTLLIYGSENISLPPVVYEMIEKISEGERNIFSEDIKSDIYLAINKKKREKRFIDFGSEFLLKDGVFSKLSSFIVGIARGGLNSIWMENGKHLLYLFNLKY